MSESEKLLPGETTERIRQRWIDEDDRRLDWSLHGSAQRGMQAVKDIVTLLAKLEAAEARADAAERGFAAMEENYLKVGEENQRLLSMLRMCEGNNEGLGIALRESEQARASLAQERGELLAAFKDIQAIVQTMRCDSISEEKLPEAEKHCRRCKVDHAIDAALATAEARPPSGKAE